MGVSATMRCVVLFFAESAISAISASKSGCGGPDFNFLSQYALYLSSTKSSDSLSSISMKVDQLNQKGNRSNIR